MSDQTITMSQEEYIKLLQQPLITELKGVNKNIDTKFENLNTKIDDTDGRHAEKLEKHDGCITQLLDRMARNDFKTNLLWASSGVLCSGLVALFVWMFQIVSTGGK